MTLYMAVGILVGAVLWMDRVFMFQIMVSRPLIMGFLIGLVMGDMKTGLLVGTSYELLWLNAPPVGTYLPNDESFCTAVAVPAAVFADNWMDLPAAAGIAILLGMPFSMAGRSLDMHIRTLNERLIQPVSFTGEQAVRSAMRMALLRSFAFALLSIGVCTCLAAAAIFAAQRYIPSFIQTPLTYVPFICMITGLSALVTKDLPARYPSGMLVLGIAIAYVLIWIL
jgi:mannose/fructose/N-acetylgalactosamine-specific phosphotransferase system component IIC